MLMAGIDGFHNRLYSLDPVEPIERLYHLPPQDFANIALAPVSYDESRNALTTDRSFLLQADVFTSDVIETHLCAEAAR